MFGLFGVYKRYVISGSVCFQIKVLRLLCKQTGATVSLLPDFAQPYRLLESKLVEDFFFNAPMSFYTVGTICLKVTASVLSAGMANLAQL